MNGSNNWWKWGVEEEEVLMDACGLYDDDDMLTHLLAGKQQVRHYHCVLFFTNWTHTKRPY